MKIPTATYRLQFTPTFTFENAEAIIPYLEKLGISDLYASPIFQAQSGSTHGYDVVDPNQINPELGGIAGLEKLLEVVQNNQLGWIQDIVPNHMAFSSQNSMLVDVLENGQNSQYKDYFDIDWNHPYEGIRDRVLAPFLGKFYGDCLESGELKLQYDKSGFTINYWEWKFPIHIESYSNILDYKSDELRRKLGRNHPDFVKFLGVLYAIKYIPTNSEQQERYAQITFIKSMLWELWNDNGEIREFIEANIEYFNGEVGKPESFNLLDDLLNNQFFRLSFWKVGNEELNYRRFFTVNDLICLRVEDEDVFNKSHKLVLDLLDEGKFTGLRIDHIDGLYDPEQYLNRLRDRAENAYIVVEKILEPHEDLRVNWRIEGTTGYDFLNYVNGIFCQQENQGKFDTLYTRFIGLPLNCQRLVDENKRLIINKHLSGDIDNLARLLKQIADQYRYSSDFTIYGLKEALVEVMMAFPVYRTYINSYDVSTTDQQCIEQVIAKIQDKIPSFLNELLNEITFIEKFLLLRFDENLSEDDKDRWLHFVMRQQQFTGPLMAKSVEDTVLYIYNRLVSLNEVGSAAGEFGFSLDEFHDFNQRQNSDWPHGMNGTSTHDTKRGEDVRSRINILSEIPEEWETYLQTWGKMNAGYKDSVRGVDVPTRNDEYFLYQTLLGTYPFELKDKSEFVQRIKDYLIKAIREAKVNTAWLRPDTAYEDGFLKFVDSLFKSTKQNKFLPSFQTFQKKIQHYGIFNSLSQTLLKVTVPGVPDFYQGTERWDLSLVDPDNRRPVDFKQRLKMLNELQSQWKKDKSSLLQQLLEHPEDGKIKLFTIHQILRTRQDYPDLFQWGDYQKLAVNGSLRQHIITFVRTWNESSAIAIAPRFLTSLIKEDEYPLGEQVWHETRISLPAGSPAIWKDVITGQEIEAENTIWIRDVLNLFPVALLIKQT
ncbi:malto-oligosyltrehalose synthase [Roseofilum casamattae]|uniref:Malto-oligosyltrehalose synthase n=1 Tax=Roseofilum casamattae BLCC-M143 TaxID=3022442 RepID=A0ABT7BX98_9CYAN|nr:malto-oligosyltrehalose synthase [Roseofilum casamattae]MDJ1183807.1 malto-oligosyltrehalose synthase [Roseofilum casamattae BLCC-M143]